MEAVTVTLDTPALRKVRGAFFTPPEIAEFLVQWAANGDPDARIVDPTCGDGVFLLAAAKHLRSLRDDVPAVSQITGVDLHQESLAEAESLLSEEGATATLIQSDFFDLSPASVPHFDAVVGNPPFVRYQTHKGEARQKSVEAALQQGVRLSGLASSWAAALVHAAGFLKDDGRLAMVLPAEVLTVGYAEPVRQWLKARFAAVNLVLFDRLQFHDATEQVVLLTAEGRGTCDHFRVFHVNDADDLAGLEDASSFTATPSVDGKWSDFLLTPRARELFTSLADGRAVRLDHYGTPELGIVTGANAFFALSEAARRAADLDPRLLTRISPPGTKHLRGLSFDQAHWEECRIAGDRVWLLTPPANSRSEALKRYVAVGKKNKVDKAYKCSIRDPWWRPPAGQMPDLFFTYMSHRFPRLIANNAEARFLNSMHGLKLRPDAPAVTKAALPLLAMNSLTLLGGELRGRSYGGGILKMEPREAASLPVPNSSDLSAAWSKLSSREAALDGMLRDGKWWAVVAAVDAVLLSEVMQLPADDVAELRDAATMLRVRRTRQTDAHGEGTDGSGKGSA